MTNIGKTFKCSSCSTDFPLSVSTDLEVNDFTMLSKCPKCGNSMQIHFGVIKPEARPAQPTSSGSEAHPLDETFMVPPEMPSSEIRQLIEG